LEKLKLKKTWFLPADQRTHFTRPLGSLLASSTSCAWPIWQAKKYIAEVRPSRVVVVGDVAVQSFCQYGLDFHLGIVDQRTQRQPFSRSLHHRLLQTVTRVAKITNQPGTISNQSLETVNQSIGLPGSTLIQVTGEEDLTVLPAILLSPLNSLVFYGQPHQGLVAVRVTPAKKQHVLKLLSFMA
jgi:hypothetical protein